MTSTPIPAPRMPTAHPHRGTLDDDQIHALLQMLHEIRVERREGAGAHLQSWDVRRTLIRIFGFGHFDVELRSMQHINTHTDKQGRVTTTFTATVRLHIRNRRQQYVCFHDGSATITEMSGDGVAVKDVHHNATTAAESTALKRAAINLGDQFGLSLYNGGKTFPVVIRSLVHLNGAMPPELEPIVNPPKPAPVDEGQPSVAEATTTDAGTDDTNSDDTAETGEHSDYSDEFDGEAQYQEAGAA